jgi:hypothetical protein
MRSRRGPHLVLAATLALALAAGPAAARLGHLPSVVMGLGKQDRTIWSAAIQRVGKGKGASAERSCMAASTARFEHGSLDLGGARDCFETPVSRRAKGPPLVLTVEERGITVVGTILPPAARKIRVAYANGDSKTIRLRRLKVDEARSVGLTPALRFTAFAVSGSWCGNGLTSLDDSGKTLWSADPVESCPQ